MIFIAGRGIDTARDFNDNPGLVSRISLVLMISNMTSSRAQLLIAATAQGGALALDNSRFVFSYFSFYSTAPGAGGAMV
jgi:hypothetical protein